MSVFEDAEVDGEFVEDLCSSDYFEKMRCKMR